MTSDIVWTPTEEDVASANLTALAQRLGAQGFDALHEASVREPEAYWRALLDRCNFVWSRPWTSYADLSDGRPFPRFFVGGELNWVDTALRWADDPARRDAPAVVAEREGGSAGRLSYAELRQRARALATGLRERGIVRGDRVGLLIENGAEAMVTLLAVSHLGAIVVPLFSGFGADAIAARLGACGAKALVTTSGFVRRGRFVDTIATVRAALSRLPRLELVVVVGADGAAPDGFAAWEDVLGDPDAAGPAERMAPSDPFMVVYTSGTTGRPKGTVHTHGGFPLKVLNDAHLVFDLDAGDVFLWPADVGWVAGPITIVASLLTGATLVAYDGAPDVPNWSRLSRLCAAHRVTHLGASPTLVRAMMANETAAMAGDTSSTRLLLVSGETIAPEPFAWFQQSFGGGRAPLINYSGGTEASGGILANVVVKPIRASGFSAVVPGIRADVVDAAGRPVRGVPGELAVLDPFVGMTQGFWQDNERYLATYWEAIPDVWVHGDLALREDDGTVFLLGRSDDTLMIAGKRVGPSEVEEVATSLAEVEEAAAIGVDDAAKGEALVVFVVLAAGADGAGLREAIIAAVVRDLGRPFAPKEVFVVADLPRTRSSKVMRRVVRSVATGRDAGDLSSLANPEAVEEIRAVVGLPRGAAM